MLSPGKWGEKGLTLSFKFCIPLLCSRRFRGYCGHCLSAAAAGCPLLSQQAISLPRTIDPGQLLAASSHT